MVQLQPMNGDQLQDILGKFPGKGWLLPHEWKEGSVDGKSVGRSRLGDDKGKGFILKIGQGGDLVEKRTQRGLTRVWPRKVCLPMGKGVLSF